MNNILPTSEWLAGFMHTTYENIAERVGWETQKITRVPFDDLPAKNKSVMLQLASFIIANFEERLEYVDQMRCSFVNDTLERCGNTANCTKRIDVGNGESVGVFVCSIHLNNIGRLKHE